MTISSLLLAAPGLLSLPAAFLGGQRPLAHLARRAAAPRSEPAGIERALGDALALAGDGGSAPYAAYGAGLTALRLEEAPITFADPVHLEAGRADVILGARVADLTPDESAAFVNALNAHLAVDGLEIVEARPDAWFARTASHASGAAAAALSATARVPPPERVTGRSVTSNLPAGLGAAVRLRWQGEIEMLLHTHAANTSRAARGVVSVDALWLWGGGRLPAAGGVPRSVVRSYARPGRLGDLVTGIALASQGSALPWDRSQPGIAHFVEALAAGSALGQAAESSPPPSSARSPAPESPSLAIAAIEPIRGEDDALAFVRDWLVPALARLEARSIGELVLIADGPGGAAVWRARIPGLAARIRARFERHRFEVPLAADERSARE